MRVLLRIVLLTMITIHPGLSRSAEGKILDNLQTPPNSVARLAECLKVYPDAKSRELAECWRGERGTKNEVCQAVWSLLNNSWVSDWQKAAAFSGGQKFGCF